MAVNFLEKSPTYVGQTDSVIRRRRTIVSQFLKGNYKVTRYSGEEMTKEITRLLRAEGIESNVLNFHADRQLFRATYLWLIATEEEKANVLANVTFKTGIRCLMKDGIRCWADLQLHETAPSGKEEAVAEIPPPTKHPTPETTSPTEEPSMAEESEPNQLPAKPVETAADETQLDPKEILEELNALQPILERLANRLKNLCADQTRLMVENAKLQQDVSTLTERLAPSETEHAALTEENARLKTENAALAERLRESEAYAAYAETENADLEDRLRGAEERIADLHSETLEQIADLHPELPQLYAVVQDMRSHGSRRHEKMMALQKTLPRKFSWASESGDIEYKPAFLRALVDLRPEEQHQICEQLGVLANHGWEYASLQSRKNIQRFPFTPSGCFTSRGADDLRFTWTKNGALIVHWVYRKGDRRVKQKEA